MRLHTTQLGASGPRVAFCHGLFGQGKNWTQAGKAIAADHQVTLVDLPDHGRSDWSDEVSYVGMARALGEALRGIGGDDRWTLVGHSMGGKTVMAMTLLEPELVERLVVVDMSPVSYGGLTAFDGYVEAMQGLDLESLGSRADADAALSEAVPDRTVRAFLLQNLRRTDDDGWRWQVNLDLVGRSMEALGGWPADELPDGARWDGPTLWVAGAESPYVKDEYAPAMRELFPKARLVSVKGAGHWVHSERPDVFLQTLTAFLGSDR